MHCVVGQQCFMSSLPHPGKNVLLLSRVHLVRPLEMLCLKMMCKLIRYIEAKKKVVIVRLFQVV